MGLFLQCDDIFLTPVHSASFQRKHWLSIEPERNQKLQFDVRRIEVPVGITGK